MLGKPAVAGTRVTVELILEKLAAGESIAVLIRSHPRVDARAVREALRFAGQRTGEVLDRLGLASGGGLLTAVNELDDKADDERLGAPDRSLFPGDPEPTAFQVVAGIVETAGVSSDEAYDVMQVSPASNVPLILLKIAEEGGVEEFVSRYGMGRAEALIALGFAAELLRIYR